MLNFLNFLFEEKEHHVVAVPQVGFEPHSHMGHVHDLGKAVSSLPGKKVIGVSKRASHFNFHERRKIFKRQLESNGHKGIEIHPTDGAGSTLRKAASKVNKPGKRILHLVVGHDRRKMAEGLKKSLHAGKIGGIAADHFHEIHIHTPEDSDRSHGMSGTNMRRAAHENDLDEYHRHLGKGFSKDEAKTIMKKTQSGIKSGSIPLKR